ncbi:MAG: hypothetical protein IPI31_05850 [Bacteroidetes bacterium]|nr:hypothetical protein [Bacteroidota bacterium]MBP9797106.1 hypothetical protein [Chitinophagales bacterium]
MRKIKLIFLLFLLPITLLAQGVLDGIEISNTTLDTENNSSPGTFILPDIAPTSTAEQTEAFHFIMQYQMGVAGTGFYKKDEYIGLCSAESKKGGPWKPIDGYKKTLCGNLIEKSTPPSADYGYPIHYGDDSDFNAWVDPLDVFKFIGDSSTRPGVIAVTTRDFEIREKLKGTLHYEINFQNSDADIYVTDETLNYPENNQTCVYGPWVLDLGHRGSPLVIVPSGFTLKKGWAEIHPIQQMWQTQDRGANIFTYDLLFARDNSTRFNSISDFESCNGDTKKVWIPEKMENSYYVAIEIPIESEQYNNYILTQNSANGMEILTDGNVIVPKLVYKNKVLATVQLPNANYKAEFVEMCKSTNNTLQGYLKITTSLLFTEPGAYAFCTLLLEKQTKRKQFDVKYIITTKTIKVINKEVIEIETNNNFISTPLKAILKISGNNSINSEIILMKDVLQVVDKSISIQHKIFNAEYLKVELLSPAFSGEGSTIQFFESPDGIGLNANLNDFNGRDITKQIYLSVVESDPNIADRGIIYTLEMVFNIKPYEEPFPSIIVNPSVRE